jgi:16S rRNA (cytosine1402-N4)-methyltransferase
MDAAPFMHLTVLRREAAGLLEPAPGKLILDGTLGGGGHAEALLEAGAQVIGLDQDQRALAAAASRLAPHGDRLRTVHANFRDARGALDAMGIGEIDGALVDLGVSSPQLDDPSRGFSFRAGGPLDMRMDPSRGAPLSQRLGEWDEEALESILATLGEERFARRIARALKRAHAAGAIADTAQLAQVVADAVPRAQWPKAIHPATKTFQALRIAVNDELGALSGWLASLPRLLKRGGRAAAISFHSLEDRMVKQEFARLATGCTCPPLLPQCVCGKSAEWKVLTRGAVQAGDEEVAANPRARSARLRAIERLQ